MLEVHMKIYNKIDKIDRTYYLDVSEVALYNYLNDKGMVKSWQNGKMVLDVSEDLEVVLYTLEANKTISLDKFANKIRSEIMCFIG